MSANSYQTDPDVEIPFDSRSTAVINDGSEAAAVSFDGVNDHAILVPGKASSGMVFDRPWPRIWLRLAAGSGPTDVQVIAGAAAVLG
ncbi:MAG: hypothetical protein ACODAA_03960 [Gemmatimonadota bacterium]